MNTMNMKKFTTIAIWAALLLAAPVQAVNKYSCDFESVTDRERWVLNPAANQDIYSNLTNKWYIGAPGNNGKGGSYGLYISDNNGLSAHYSNNGCWVIAYDTISLDTLATAGADYTLCFDYCGMGNVGSKFDGIYVMWIPMIDPETGDSVKVGSVATSAGKIPSAYDNYIISLQKTAMIDYVGGTQTWKQCIATIPNKKCDGTPHYLAIVWANTSNQEQQPGGMVDNIMIMDTRPCDEPTDLKQTIQGTTSILTWTGTTAEYEVSAYSYEEKTWYGPKIVQGTTTSFANLPIGQTDFVVRSKCADDLYSLKTTISKLVYYPDQMCVDYLDLNNATCYIGQMGSSDNTHTFNAFTKTPPIDNGPASIESRHTIHFDKAEIEPRTGGIAKTIPDGELASVRLGNWDKGAQAERIEFSFEVDTINYPVLLLKYMPILEAPNHSERENPRFRLDILIGNKTIGECGQADFSCDNVYNKSTKQLLPGAAEQGWHVTPGDIAQANGSDVVWKEWTTVGVNLKNPDYAGKKLMARLTTLDCTASGHCGYAYFTLGCSDGNLKGMKCGEINPVFEAPDGFVYRWAYKYNEKFRLPDGSIPEEYVLGHEQTFEAGLMDDSVYVVDCMFVQDSTCFFSLYASTLATNPIAKMKMNIQKNCTKGKYTVHLDASDSWVQEIDHVTGDTLPSRVYKIDRYEWNVDGLPGGWSDEVAPTFEFPSSGGTWNISLKTSCGICDSTIYYTLHLDSLSEVRDTIQMALCDDVKKQGYVWPEKPDTTYYDYGLDSVVLFNEATSCDSIIYLLLTEPVRITHDTLVLPDYLPFEYHGRSYNATGVDTIPISATNCDTTWILNLEVYESVRAHMPDTNYILCDGDSILQLVYNITRGRSLRYSYGFDDPSLPSVLRYPEVQKKGQYTLDVPLNPTPYPNVYRGSLTLDDSIPKWNLTIPFTLTVRYANTVMAQRWNDVLAVRNSAYNGGYEFSEFQWFKNGVKLEGETGSYLYQPLDVTAEYQVLLTRASDGVALLSCSLVPVLLTKDEDLPTLAPKNAPMRMNGKGRADWVTTLGNTVYSEHYDNSPITTPQISGMYVLILHTESGKRVQRMIIQ